MPDWLLNWVLPLVLQVVTPVLVELVRRLLDQINRALPGPMVVPLAGAVAEAINQLQAQLTGAPLPAGVGGLVAIMLNETKNYYQKKLDEHPGGI